MSAATLGLDWTKTSLASVQTSLHAETDAVMKSLNSITDDSKKDGFGRLQHRGVLLRDQHKLLLSLFKNYKLHRKKIQQTNSSNEDDWFQETAALQNTDIWQQHSTNRDIEATTDLQPTTSDVVLGKRRFRAGDQADVGKPESNVQNQHIYNASSSHTSLPESVGKNVWNADVSSRLYGASGRGSDSSGSVDDGLDDASVDSIVICTDSDDDDRTVAREGGNCSDDHSLSHQQTDTCRHSLNSTVTSPHHTHRHTTNTASRGPHDDTVSRDVCVTAVSNGTVIVPRVTAAAVDTLPCFSSVGDSQPASQPVCELTEMPAAKRLRLPPPSPSLLSLSSASPPMSPLLIPPPASRPLPPVVMSRQHPAAAAAAAAPRCLAAQRVCRPSHVLHQPTQHRATARPTLLPLSAQHGLPTLSGMSGPASRLTSVTTLSSTAAGPAVDQRADDELSLSQCSHKSLTKTAPHRPCFSLKQLIADGIIQPGHDVLSVRNPVMFYCQSIISV